jgi:FKBP-type peptidyl-prolyl cis-trans isomerase
MKKTFVAFVAMFALVAACGCQAESESEADATAETVTEETTAAEETTTEEPEILSKESGVRYQELVVGTGAEAALRDSVECHYTLWLADSTGLVKGDKVDSSVDRGQPFTCQLGVRLIQGWSDGMVGMKEGGKRRLLVPWQLGYPNGAGARIPPQTNLIFEIEFLKKL